MAKKNVDVAIDQGEEKFHEEPVAKTKKNKPRGKSLRSKTVFAEVNEEEVRTVQEETIPIIVEEEAPTILEDRDLQEKDSEGKPIEDNLEALQIASDEQVAEIDENYRTELDEMLKSLEGRPEDEYIDDPEFESDFDAIFSDLDGSLDRDAHTFYVDADAPEEAVRFDHNIEEVSDDVEEIVEQKIKVWDVERGQQRVEAFGRGVKRFFAKGKELFSGLFGKKVTDGLKTFGSVAKNLGYGTLAAAENLPQVIAKELYSGVVSNTEKAAGLYRDFSKSLVANFELAKAETKSWFELKKRQREESVARKQTERERREFEKLKAQRNRFEELRSKFETAI